VNPSATNANRRLVDIKGPDYYPTPAWATEALINKVSFSGAIVEPCCGEGYMSIPLRNSGYTVVSSDKYDYGYGEVHDALTIQYADNIVTNPPYNMAAELLQHFLTITQNKICLLLKMAFLDSVTRYPLFMKYRPTTVWVFPQRLTMSPKDVIVKGGGTISYGWMVWDNQSDSISTTLDWLDVGHKRRGLK